MLSRGLVRTAFVASGIAFHQKTRCLSHPTSYKHTSSLRLENSVTSAQAVTSSTLVTGHWNGTIRTSDKTMEQFWPVRSIAKLPDGTFATSDAGQICVWDHQTGLRVFCPEQSPTISAMVGFPNNLLAVVRWSSDHVEIWDSKSGQLKWSLKGHADEVKYIAALAHNRVASYAWDRTIRIWNLDNGECERVIESGYVGSLLALPDDTLVTAGLSGIKVWVDGKCEKEIEMSDLPWNPRMVLAPDGTLLITAFKTSFREVDLQTKKTKDAYSLLMPDHLVALTDKVVTFGPGREMNVFEIKT